VRVIKGIKEILGGARGKMELDVLMKVLFDCRIRLFVMGVALKLTPPRVR